ncbi:hypothetical protein ZIOFF_026096 [Zingiber officinale]|uniref:RNA-binding S4 domain-containing protein n=1 Tax=Zingiber officinale TaxID=94328 RepID=A0A8J5GYM2_ZINOF|nr:hypothetical protein ZIOFF_026096 [Zingiber officinale]
MAGAAMAFAVFHPRPSLLCTGPLLPFQAIRRISFLRLASSSSTSPTAEFNISFGASPSPGVNEAEPRTLVPDTSPTGSSNAPMPMLIPWIVRGEDGQFTIQSSPPARFLQDMAEAKMEKKAKKKNDKKNSPGAMTSIVTSASPPKYSKAARRFYNQHIKQKSQRLSKVLAASGVNLDFLKLPVKIINFSVASRRNCEEIIFEGKVTVNGSVCTSPQTRVDIAKDSIYVNGNRLSKKLPPKLYFALNKPKGYICSSADDSKSVISLFDDFLKKWIKSNPGIPKPRLFTVGRLDVATTGLIIVTNDGDFTQKISHPSSELTKEYVQPTLSFTLRKYISTIDV